MLMMKERSQGNERPFWPTTNNRLTLWLVWLEKERKKERKKEGRRRRTRVVVVIVYSEPLVVCVCVCTASAHFLLIGVQPVTGELRIDLPISKTKRRKINKYKKKKGEVKTRLFIYCCLLLLLLPLPPGYHFSNSFFQREHHFFFPFFFCSIRLVGRVSKTEI